MNRTHRTVRTLMLFLHLLGFIEQATTLTCYSGPASTTKTTQCKKKNESCAILKRYSEGGKIATLKGCCPNCRNGCTTEPLHNIERCYTCCAENLCNDETKSTLSQRATVTINSTPRNTTPTSSTPTSSTPTSSTPRNSTPRSSTPRSSTPINSAPTVKKRIATNAGIMKNSEVYLFFLIFLAQILILT